MLEVRGVSKVYPRRGGTRVDALLDVSLSLGPGEVVVCAGPEGAGKSTLLRLVWGAERPTRGTITVGGQEAARGGSGLARLRRGLGVVPEEGPLLTHRTAFGNVVFALRALGRPRREARVRAVEALRAVGLAERLTALPGELGAGGRRRLLLARALAPAPALLLVDGVPDGLDEDLVTLVRRLAGEGMALLLATRAAGLAARLSARLVTLEAGRLRGEPRPA